MITEETSERDDFLRRIGRTSSFIHGHTMEQKEIELELLLDIKELLSAININLREIDLTMRSKKNDD